MAVQTQRPRDGMLPLFALLGVVTVALLAWWPIVVVAAVHDQVVPHNPVALAIALARHTVPWPGSWVFAVYAAQALVLAVAAGLLVRRRWSRSRGRTRADGVTRHLAGPADMVGLTPSQVRASAARLRPGASLDTPDEHGVLVAETLLSRTPLRMSWEDITVVIAGPRVGKTTSNVVPAVVGYRGPLKTSSNKPDVHDATRGVRDAFGQCWLCDPQGLVGTVGADGSGAPSFWWNPLDDVADLATARELVQVLIDTTVDPDSKPDAYFHPTAKSLLVNYVFAAALAGKTLGDVDVWLGDVEDTEAVNILRDRGFAAAGAQIKSVLSKPDRQRDGVLGTAQSWLAVITDPRYAAWLTPPAGSAFFATPRFDPAEFVRSAGDTIYLLSQEGPASAAFITTAVNAAIDRAGIAYARTLPGRRLTNPVLSVLDEAANTIRDTTLPDKVSHFGSRGLPTMIVLQSWSQGVEIWGERGMRKLWSAANVKLYLGGVAESEFLKSMSDLLGDRDERYWTSSSSHAGSGSSTTRGEQIRRLPIQSVAELSALPRGRAVVFSSGNRPALARPVPWMTGPHAAAIAASLQQWESPDRGADRAAQTHRAAAELATTESLDLLLTDRQLASAIEHEGVLL